MSPRIIKPERDTQNRVVDTLLSVLNYRYLGNLENEENSNIRENDLRKFLKEKQGCNDTQASEAIRVLKQAAACNSSQALYDKGLECYQLIRNGENISQGYGQVNRHVNYIDWENPLNNDFALAEEVTVRRVTEDLKHRRPDLVVYVNGIALVVIELKKISVSVADAIRQNRRNQEDGEICHFFTTVQLLLAGNESEGVKYGVTKTPEEFWLKWKEPAGEAYDYKTGKPLVHQSPFSQREFPNEMFRSLLQMLEPSRLLEFIHDCIIYDGGIKKAARPNQYFALVASKKRFEEKASGIIWHSQGSGKSLTMIWLAQWIKEQGNDARIVIITDRDELDKQIEIGFKDTGETPFRAKSGEQLIKALNNTLTERRNGRDVPVPMPSIVCTLIHKFGVGLHDDDSDDVMRSVGDRKAKRSPEECMEQIANALPENFTPKGKIVVFIDECHRAQGGILHKAMKKIMGDDVMLIGFTGTPLFKNNKQTTREQFGEFIHTYKFDEAVKDKVILDLRYEARNIEQEIDDDDKESIDQIFDAKTLNMTPRAKAALRDKWVTFQNIYSSDARVRKIVRDICKDMVLLKPLEEGYGNAMLVAGSIYQAFKFWDAFQSTALKDKTAVVSSYDPQQGVSVSHGHSTDADNDEETFKCNTAKRMIGEQSAEDFEEWAKEEFIKRPRNMKLLIVVDKLLTGFDAPTATYLYIDKHMQDHNLFQAICRVNRVESDKKEFGYIIDYKDLFNEIKGAVQDYTNGAFSNFEEGDVAGLLKNRLTQGKKDLDEALETVEGICINVSHPRKADNFFDYFVYDQATTPVDEQQAVTIENSNKREMFYDAVRSLTNRYLAIATQMVEAGYTVDEAKAIHDKVTDFDNLRSAIMLRSGDTTDLKGYNAMMRQLLDQYVQAPRSELIAKLEDFSFLDLIDDGKDSNEVVDGIVDEEPAMGGEPAVAETISANVRKYVVRKRDSNPEYFDKLSERLNKILEEMKDKSVEYKETLKQLIEMIKEIKHGTNRPDSLNTDGKRALFDNLNNDEALALKVYDVIIATAEQGFRDENFPGRAKRKKIRDAVSNVEGMPADKLDVIMSIVINNPEF